MLGMHTKKTTTKSLAEAESPTLDTWMDHEVGGCNFGDVRLAKRFGKLLGMLSHGIGQSVPYACQDWANTKAAYRFFSNEEVSEDQIMAGHFQATRGRLSHAGQKILMLHDTCEFSFQREKDSKIGLLGRPSCGKDKDGRLKHFTYVACSCTAVWLSPWTGCRWDWQPSNFGPVNNLKAALP